MRSRSVEIGHLLRRVITRVCVFGFARQVEQLRNLTGSDGSQDRPTGGNKRIRAFGRVSPLASVGFRARNPETHCRLLSSCRFRRPRAQKRSVHNGLRVVHVVLETVFDRFERTAAAVLCVASRLTKRLSITLVGYCCCLIRMINRVRPRRRSLTPK